MSKKIVFLMMFLLTLTLTLSACSSTEPELKDDSDKIVIYYFWGSGCPSCDLQSSFLDDIALKYSDVEIKRFDFSVKENKDLLDSLALVYEERIIAPPATFIAEESVIGFGSAETTGKLIDDIIKRCQSQKCKNPADVLNEKK